MKRWGVDALDDDVVQFSGELVFDTVPEIWANSFDLITSSERLIIDLSKVTRADSAGLALLVGWLRVAVKSSRLIEFRNIPEKLMAIARVSGVAEILLQE